MPVEEKRLSPLVELRQRCMHKQAGEDPALCKEYCLKEEQRGWLVPVALLELVAVDDRHPGVAALYEGVDKALADYARRQLEGLPQG